jgi:hypothetical protein
MSDFEERWRICAARARQAPACSERPPLGFAWRVLSQDVPATELGLEALWERLAMRWLAGAAGVLLVCAVIELPKLHAAPLLKPGIENTVAQLVWKL